MRTHVGIVGSNAASVAATKDGISVQVVKQEPLTIAESAELRRYLEKAEREAFLLAPKASR